MTESVKEHLDLALKADPHTSPLDAVMGEDWAEIKLGSSLRLSLLGLMLRNQEKYGGTFGKQGGGSSSNRVPLQVVRRSNQAMVKVIRKGGTSTARGMGGQMKYLAKDGDAALERSERYFGTELDEDGQKALVESWGITGEAKTESDKTTHFVVSFPIDTNEDAAYRAGRAWAEEMFAKGTYGEVYDYYTAFHTDRAHPHMHIVVNRRGLENGDWLKVSKRSLFNYEEFRAVQVEVSAREGIVLEATPRLARGVSDRQIPDAEIRGAEREGRAARPPAHTPLTAVRSAALITLFAQHMKTDAGLIAEDHPALAGAIREAAQAIMEGGEITAQMKNPIIDLNEATQIGEVIMSRRTEILEKLEHIEENISTIPTGNEKTNLDRQLGKWKADISSVLPDVENLRGYRTENSDGLYKGVVADDAVSQEIKDTADNQVHQFAKKNGLEADHFIGRYQDDKPVSQALSDQWRQDEMDDIRRNLNFSSDITETEVEALTKTAYDDVHKNALQTYRKAERDIESYRHRRRELHRLATYIQDGGDLDADVNETFRRQLKQTLHGDELRRLDRGDVSALASVSENIDDQRSLAKRYLEAESVEAEGARKLNLQTSLAKIDRDIDHSTQLSREKSRSDDGLDY